jgi:hypothetical protein
MWDELSATRGNWYLWWHRRVTTDAKILAAVAVVSVVVYIGIPRSGNSGESVSGPEPRAASPGVPFVERFDAILRDESVLYDRWKAMNPKEAVDYERYADAVKLGLAPKPPELRTPLGRALMQAASAGADDGIPYSLP